MKKRYLMTILTVVCCSFMLCACGSKNSVEESGVLNIAVVTDKKPYAYVDGETSEYTGADVEVAKILAMQMGASAQISSMDESEYVKQLNKGKIDIAIGRIADSLSLRDKVLASSSYDSDSVYIVTKRGVFVTTLGALENQTVGYAQNMSNYSLQNFKEITSLVLQYFDDYDIICSKLDDGSIKGFVCYESEAMKFLNLGDYQVQAISNINIERYVVAVQKKNYELLSLVNDSLSTLSVSDIPEILSEFE